MIKDIQVAESTIKMNNDALATIDESARVVRQTSSGAEANEYCFRVGEVFLYALDKLVQPIYDEHPELKPSGWLIK